MCRHWNTDPHQRQFLMQGNVVPSSSQQLGAFRQGKPALQMNLGGGAAASLPRKPHPGSETGWPVSSLSQSKYGKSLLVGPGEGP